MEPAMADGSKMKKKIDSFFYVNNVMIKIYRKSWHQEAPKSVYQGIPQGANEFPWLPHGGLFEKSRGLCLTL